MVRFKKKYRGAQHQLKLDLPDLKDVESRKKSANECRFVPRPEDDEKYILCLSQHDTLSGKSESDSLKLVLQYAPRVNLTLASKQPLREGGSALLACIVVAKPIDDIRISWYKNGNQLLSYTADTFFLESLKMEDHRTKYTCQASNAIGTSYASLSIDVSFGPRIMSTTQEKEVSEDEPVSFRCDAVGNPLPTILWTRAGDDQIVAKGNMITLSSARNWQQGEYLCTAIVEGFKHATLSHFLHIRGPPLITAPAELTANVGESIEIPCYISGRPKPLEVTWKRNDEELDYASGKTQIHLIPRSYGVESRLIVRDLQEVDMGAYNCTANNGIGYDTKSVIIKARGITNIFPSLGTTTLMALLAGILTLFSFTCCCLLPKRNVLAEKCTGFPDDSSDLTVKCEVLDGSSFPDMYSCGEESTNVVSFSKDYISVPQNNPDLDYMQTSAFFDFLYPENTNLSSTEYNIMSGKFEHSYGSFASGVSTSGGLSDTYGVNVEKTQRPEMLHEFEAPKSHRKSNCNSSPSLEKFRSFSRTSMHV
ncbi:hypothetical protein RB195_023506 [Necator americanus]|uniref:Ig-like domain-containing protein n=1 Tax=Necator americanus TaxID=51031 RepID=A0ABR1EJH2_NECAM